MTWKKILAILAREKQPVSGETIGKSLNLTRAAVWKQVNYLNEKGFKISSFLREGYLLEFPKDTPLVAEPEDFETDIIGKHIVSEIVTDSTNDDAIKISEKSQEGTVVIAELQTRGRGRRGRGCVSPFGKGLYFSVILKPELPVTKLPRMTILAGVAVAKSLKRYGIEVRLKWPNDIMINNKKVGGILSELFVEGDSPKYVILGVGLNIHTTENELPEEIKDTAGSLCTETGKSLRRIDIFKACAEELDRAYLQFLKLNGELGDMCETWNEMAWKKGEEVFITTGRDKEQCQIIGLREDGVLIVFKDGVQKEIYVGEILL